VFEYHWHDVITYDVMLVLLSFIIAWGEAWFFDFRMIPLENKVDFNFLSGSKTLVYILFHFLLCLLLTVLLVSGTRDLVWSPGRRGRPGRGGRGRRANAPARPWRDVAALHRDRRNPL
jgi:hypothetical protein